MAKRNTDNTVIIMNAKGSTMKGMAEKRKKYIKDTLKTEQPFIVFVQEFDWIDFETKAWRGFDIPQKFKYVGHGHAGFVINGAETTHQRIENTTKVRRIYDRMHKDSGLGPDVFELPRLCVCIVKSKGAPRFKCICVSWHGPYKIETEKRKRCLEILLEFLLKLKVEYGNLPLILGGDFNLKAKMVKDLVPKCLELYTPNDESIDFAIISSDMRNIFHFEAFQQLPKTEAFDHHHLKSIVSPS